MHLLDTHIWLWFARDEKKLDSGYKTLLENSSANSLAVSAISVWEIAMLTHRGRLTLHQSTNAWVAASLDAMRAHVIPLDTDIAVESYALPGDFHGDPADRMIIATARQKGLRLITQDRAILTYARKGHVMLAK